MADSNEGSWQGEVLHQTKAGKPVTVLTRKTKVPETAANSVLTLVVDTDITEKKQLQAEFYQAQRLESLGSLARGIAHDFKNILNPVRVIPQLLLQRMPDADSKTREMLQTLVSASDQGTALSQQILTFGGKYQARGTSLRLEALLEELEQFIHHSFPKTIIVQTRVADDLTPVLADSTLMHQVLMNLCVNARDAMPEGGTLQILAQNISLNGVEALPSPDAHTGDYAMITIADTGVGIPRRVLEQMYEPFFTTKNDGKGTGLGLSTVARIVKDLGGFMQVSSEVNQGTEFKVFLPRAADQS